MRERETRVTRLRWRLYADHRVMEQAWRMGKKQSVTSIVVVVVVETILIWLVRRGAHLLADTIYFCGHKQALSLSITYYNKRNMLARSLSRRLCVAPISLLFFFHFSSSFSAFTPCGMRCFPSTRPRARLIAPESPRTRARAFPLTHPLGAMA